MFVYIMEEINWKDSFQHGFFKTKKMAEVLERKLEQNNPRVYKHMDELGCFDKSEGYNFSMAIFGEFITLMLQKLPLQLSGRLLDVFLLEGEKVLFDVYLRIFYFCQNQILQITCREVLDF